MSRKKSLLSKLLLFIGVPVAAVFCITAFIVLMSVKQSVAQLTTSELAEKSKAASYQISEYFSKYSDTVIQMAANDSFQQYFQQISNDTGSGNEQDFAGVKKTIDNILETDPDNYSSVWIADYDTNRIIISSSDQPYEMKLSDKSWYRSIVDKKVTVTTEPYKDQTTGSSVVSMVAPVFKTGTKDIIGFVGVDITINRLFDMVKGYKLGQTGFYILATAEGQLVYHPNASLKGKNILESKMSKNIINSITKKAVGAITYTNMNQTNFGYLSTIGNTGWTITTGIPEKEYNKTYHAVQTTVLTVFIIALLLLILLIIVVSQSIIYPLKKLTRAALQVADGNLDVQIELKSSDETGQVAMAFSRTIERLKQYIDYINEISTVLDKIALGDLVFELHCDYAGEFSKIKTSLENIKFTLVKIFSDITVSADQVASGSGQVSNGAQALAQGATEQASSIQELSAEITEISSNIKLNAEHASNASLNVGRVHSEIEVSNQYMDKMVAAMAQINESSGQIKKIIKTIEDIAFQTNILALNAAVEAARAGAAGKGFSVVADEVRNLASKSAEAAKNITSLIQESMNQVENGTKIVDETAKSLLNVVDNAKIVSETVKQISQASKQQADTIGQVMLGVEQISSVVQTNSATAEESAAASEELSGQAKVLNSLVQQFKLKEVISPDKEDVPQSNSKASVEDL